MPSLKAAPGRVVLRFPNPEEETRGGIIIPQTSQQRPEFATIHDLGDPLSEDDIQLRFFFREVRRAGQKVAVSYMSGVSYWKENYDPKQWGWLKAYRVYRYGELASVLVESDEVAAAMKLETEAV